MPLMVSYNTFCGQAVDNTSILIAYTRGADANLDGRVDNTDVTIIGGCYGRAGTWATGDFDYNGIDDDTAVLGGLFNPSAPLPVSMAPFAGLTTRTVRLFTYVTAPARSLV